MSLSTIETSSRNFCFLDHTSPNPRIKFGFFLIAKCYSKYQKSSNKVYIQFIDIFFYSYNFNI